MSYYLYFYLDPRKPGKYSYRNISFLYEPFYIGKGKGGRCLSHLKEATNSNKNSFKLNKIRKIIRQELLPSIIILDIGSESYILSEETQYIKEVGRLIDNSGPLTNIKIDNSQYSKMLLPKQQLHYSKKPSKTVIHIQTNEMFQVELSKLPLFLNNGFAISDEWVKERANNSKSRVGKQNGMFGKPSKSKDKKWVMINNISYLLSPGEIHNLTESYTLGRKVSKNSRRRIIIKDSKKSKYLSNFEIRQLPYGTEYQIGLLWRNHKEIFIARNK